MQRVGGVATRCDFASLLRRSVVLFFNKFLKRFVTDCRTCFAVVFSPRFQVNVSLTVTKKRNIFYSFTTVELWRRKIRKKERRSIKKKPFAFRRFLVTLQNALHQRMTKSKKLASQLFIRLEVYLSVTSKSNQNVCQVIRISHSWNVRRMEWGGTDVGHLTLLRSLRSFERQASGDLPRYLSRFPSAALISN